MKTNLTATLQKSYYGKAKTRIEDGFIILTSYNTDVVAIDVNKTVMIRLWAGWSATTAKHINDFLLQNGFAALSKKEWMSIPCVNDEPTYNMYISTGFATHKSNILLTEAEAETEVERISKQSNNRLTCWYE